MLKTFFLNKEHISPIHLLTLALSIATSIAWIFYPDKVALIKSAVSFIGFVLLIQLYLLVQKYKQPVASIYKKYFHRNDELSEILGVQHEIQQKIGALLKAWLGKNNKKIVLFIDDLDRCDIDQVSGILDGLRLILDDKAIYKHLIIIVAVDDSIVRASIISKYKDYIEPINKEDLFEQYLEKIFIFGIKLMPLSDTDSMEIFDVMQSHLFPKEISENENGTKLRGKDSHDSMIGKEPLDASKQPPHLSDFESELIRTSVTHIKNATPRTIKIFIYKYVLFVELYAALIDGEVTQEASESIVQKLLGNESEVNDEYMDKVAGVLSAL